MTNFHHDELVPVLQCVRAMLSLLAFRTRSDDDLSELLHRAAELVDEAIKSQIQLPQSPHDANP
jgi:hypothetical protein